jgi:predicted TIM-barrel fold metal-dependent hydrolase
MTIVDAAAHPVGATGDEIRRYMQEPWRSAFFPGPERYHYASPFGEYDEATVPDGGGLPGSDPALLLEQLGPDAAARIVLLPLTRGLLPNTDLATAICSATNDWLAEHWLGADGRFRGSIRINPSDPDAAVAEIARWADDPRFVQVAVPLQAHHPYGQRGYFPIWQAAAERGLPVAIHADGGASVDFHPSSAGPLRYALEYNALLPFTAAYHLASLIAEGVLERLPDVRFVFADGGLSALVPIIWRLDKDWRSTRVEVPWTTKLPSAYIREQVRFCLGQSDLPRDRGDATWWSIAQADELLLYASNYPQFDWLSPDAPAHGGTPARVFADNARELYGGRLMS